MLSREQSRYAERDESLAVRIVVEPPCGQPRVELKAPRGVECDPRADPRSGVRAVRFDKRPPAGRGQLDRAGVGEDREAQRDRRVEIEHAVAQVALHPRTDEHVAMQWEESRDRGGADRTRALVDATA